jgi:hypothetical protein
MKINFYTLGKILGLGFAVVLIKMFFAPDDTWLNIIGTMLKGVALWL